MAKNIIVQVWAGELNDMVLMSTSLAAKYCKKYGISHRFVLKNQVTTKHPTWEKLLVWDEEFSGYDNVMILDTDIMIRPHSPNLFEQYDFKHMLGTPCEDEWEEGAEVHHGKDHKQLITGGNIVYTKEFLDLTRPFLDEAIKKTPTKNCDEHVIRTAALAAGSEYYTNTHLHWNWGVKRHGYIPDEAYFIHYHAQSKKDFSYNEWDKVLKDEEAWQLTQ